LDDASIESFSKCRSSNGRNAIVDWNVNAYDGNEIDVEDLSVDDLCASTLTSSLSSLSSLSSSTSKDFEQKAIFNHGTSHAQVHLACEKLGGVSHDL
jgi:hypothetical protein